MARAARIPAPHVHRRKSGGGPRLPAVALRFTAARLCRHLQPRSAPPGKKNHRMLVSLECPYQLEFNRQCLLFGTGTESTQAADINSAFSYDINSARNSQPRNPRSKDRPLLPFIWEPIVSTRKKPSQQAPRKSTTKLIGLRKFQQNIVH
jgi:hypothetical protein